jgi:hypothetical protein
MEGLLLPRRGGGAAEAPHCLLLSAANRPCVRGAYVFLVHLFHFVCYMTLFRRARYIRFLLFRDTTKATAASRGRRSCRVFLSRATLALFPFSQMSTFESSLCRYLQKLLAVLNSVVALLRARGRAAPPLPSRRPHLPSHATLQRAVYKINFFSLFRTKIRLSWHYLQSIRAFRQAPRGGAPRYVSGRAAPARRQKPCNFTFLLLTQAYAAVHIPV